VKHERATEETQERAALFALGSLSQHEARAFEEHLREGCPVCAADLRQQEDVVGALALAVAPAAPPAFLRDIVAARIERAGRPAAPSPQPSASVEPARPFEGVQLPQPRPRSTILPWAVAAAVALAAGASYFSTRQAANQIQAERARVEEERSRAEQARARLETETTRTRQELEDLKTALAAPGVRFIALKGTKDAPGASAQVYWDTRRNRWIVAANLPPAPSGKVYQLWFLTPRPAPLAAGLIPIDASGRGFTDLAVPSDLGKLNAAAITLEPAGGSEKPTMPIYAIGIAGP
jgi:anti-sigma-K factor RskA